MVFGIPYRSNFSYYMIRVCQRHRRISRRLTIA